MNKGITTPEFGTRPTVPNLALTVPTPAWAETREDSTDETWDDSTSGSRFTAAEFTLSPRLDPGADASVSVMQIVARSGEPYEVPSVFAYLDLVTLDPEEAREMAAALLRAADVAERARI